MMARIIHREQHFTSSNFVRDVVIGMSDGLTVPFALATMLVTSLAVPHPFYRTGFVCQVIFYALGLFALTDLRPSPLARVANAVLTLMVLNAAAVVAFSNFVTGRKEVWVR